MTPKIILKFSLFLFFFITRIVVDITRETVWGIDWELSPFVFCFIQRGLSFEGGECVTCWRLRNATLHGRRLPRMFSPFPDALRSRKSNNNKPIPNKNKGRKMAAFVFVSIPRDSRSERSWARGKCQKRKRKNTCISMALQMIIVPLSLSSFVYKLLLLF